MADRLERADLHRDLGSLVPVPVSGFGVRSCVMLGTRKPIRAPMASVAPARLRRRLQTPRRRIDPPFWVNVCRAV